MSFTIRAMVIDDYDRVVALWSAGSGIGLSVSDSREGVARYLDDDHCVGFVACDGNADEAAIVGAVLCGHDGRRGYVTHLAVTESHRRRGIGAALSDSCIEWLREQGIDKCHVVVFAHNHEAMDHYRATGWIERTELMLFSKFTTRDED